MSKDKSHKNSIKELEKELLQNWLELKQFEALCEKSMRANCTCGARLTSVPDPHSMWCPMNEQTKENP